MEDPSMAFAITGGGSHHQAQQQQQQHQLQHQQQQQQHYPHQYQYDDGMMPVDINEADERMKRYYGIVPKHSTSSAANVASSLADKDKAEIRTVRIVKRESEKRQRDKTKSRYDENSFGMDELAEEDHLAHSQSNGFYGEDPIMDDPVLSQFSHVLTLPRRSGKRDETREKRPLSQRNSLVFNEPQTDSRPLGPEQWRGSLRPRRNLSSVSYSLSTFYYNIFFSFILIVPQPIKYTSGS